MDDNNDDSWGSLLQDTPNYTVEAARDRAANAPSTWGDVGQAVKADTYDALKGVVGAAQYGARAITGTDSQYGAGIKSDLEEARQDAIRGMTQKGQAAYNSSVFDSPDWKTTALMRGAGQAPMLLASLIPGGIAARAARVAGLGEGAAAIAGSAAASAPVSAQMAGAVYNGIEDGINNTSDEDLRKQSSVYDGLRSFGVPEKEAKAQVLQQAAGYKPLLMAAAAELTGRLGAEGLAMSSAAGQTVEKGFLKRVGSTAYEEARKNAALSLGQDAFTQLGNQEAGAQVDYHWGQSLKAAAEGGILGGVTGAAAGALVRGHGEPTVTPEKEVPAEDQAALDAVKPEQPTQQAPAPTDAFDKGPPTVVAGAPEMVAADEHVADEEEQPTQVAENAAPIPAPTAANAPDNVNPIAATGPNKVEPIAAPSGGDAYARAVQIVRETGKASTSFVQRKLGLGYTDVANLIDRMEREGVVGPANHAGKRDVLPSAHTSDVSSANGVLRDGFGGLNWSNSLPLDLQRIVQREDVAETLVNPKFDDTKHVPYLAGSDLHDTKTDIDNHIPRTDPSVVGADGKPLDLWKFVNVHEQVEKALREAGHDYAGAHQMATQAELAAVKAAGADPKAYQAFWKKQAPFVEHEAKVNEPNDLYVVDKGEAGKDASGKEIEAPAGQPTDEAQSKVAEKAAAEGPRTLVDLGAEEDAEYNRKQEAQAAAKAAPRTSAAEREAVAKGEAASQTLSRDPGVWKLPKDRKAAFRMVDTELELAKKERREPADWAKMMDSARQSGMAGKGKNKDAVRALYAEGRKKLDELQGKAIEAGKTARATKEATRTDIDQAKKARLEEKKGNNELAKEAFNAAGTEPPKNPYSREQLLEHVTRLLDTAKENGTHLPERVTEGVGGHVAHLMDAKVLKDRLARVLKHGGQDSSLQSHMNSFAGNAHLLAGGHEDMVLANRKAEATKAGAFFSEEGTRAEDAGITDHPDETYEEPAITPREREAVPVDVARDVTAGVDRAGKFHVTTTGRRRFAAAGLAHEENPHESAPYTGPRHGERYDLGGGMSGHAVETHTLKDLLKRTEASNKNPLLKFFSKRLNEMVPNVKVHFVTSEEHRHIERLTGQPRTNGMYVRNEAGHHAIFVDTGQVHDPKYLARLAVHEGLHAAFHEIIETRPDIRAEIGKMIDHVKDNILPEEVANHYGLTNEHEFISEAFSNPEFQKLLASIDAPPTPAPSRIRTVYQWFLGALRQGLGIPRGTEKLLERAIKMGSVLTDARDAAIRGGSLTAQPRVDTALVDRAKRVSNDHEAGRRFVAGNQAGFLRDSRDVTDKVSDLAMRSGLKSLVGKATRYVTTTGQYVQHVAHLFNGERENNIVNKVHRLIEQQGVVAQKLRERGTDLAAQLIRDQKANPKLFARESQLINDATRMGVDPSSPLGAGRNKHLAVSQKLQARLKKGEKWEDIEHEAGLNGWAARDAHPELSREYRSIIGQDPAFAKRMQEVFNYFDDVQQDISQRHIEGFLRADEKFTGDVAKTAKDYADTQLTQELKDKLRKAHGDAVADAIIGAKKLSPGNGPYAPLMRHGNWVTRARYAIKEPTNATKIDDNTFEFATRKEAHRFAKATGLDYDADIRYYDPTTGAPTTKVGGESSAGSPIQKYRIKLNREYIEFHPTQWEATRAYRDFQKDATFDKVLRPQEKGNVDRAAGEMTAGAMATLEKRMKLTKAYDEAMQHEKEEMLRSLREAAVAVQAGNRVQSRRLPRRNVAGASTDLVRNLHEYNISQANFRAKQQFRPQIDQALRDMRDEVKSRQDLKGTEERSVVANEMDKRARAPDPTQYSGAWSDWGRRIAMINFINRMGRASHLLLHEFHLPMITAPVIGARHGYAQTLAMLASNWNRARGAYARGGKGFADALRDPLTKQTDYHGYMKRAFGDDAGVTRMFDALHKDGVIHSGMGVEIGRYMPSVQSNGPVGIVDKVFGRMDTIYRQLNDAFDAVIRYTGAASAYKLERQKLTTAGKSPEEAHELATEYARNIVENTQGHYSSTNAAPIFKNKALRPFLQFKQFPQMMYHLLIQNGIKAFRGETPTVRKEAARALIGVLATHTAMAGVLGGLPMELPKMIGAITKGLGITNNDWSDVEEWEREHLKELLGPMLGGIAANGFSRALGFDAHHRLGLNSFFTFGLPQNANGDKWSDYVLNSTLGAPAGMVEDTLKGFSLMLQGDVVDGVTRAFPLQLVRDIQLAAQGGTASYPYSPAERAFQALGFTPSGKAEMNEEVGREIGANARKKDARSQLVRAFFNATSDEERRAVASRISDYNSTAKGLDRIGVKGLQARLVARQQTQRTAKEAW